jgi:hypothetical protein
MSVRRRFLLYAGGWAVVSAAAQAAIPLAVRDRLPEPLATHWDFAGTPNRAMPLAAQIVIMVGAWLLIAGLLSLGALRGRIDRRQRRAFVAAVYAGAGVFSIGLAYVTTMANLDVASWQQARPLGWPAMLVVLAVAIVAG